MADRFFGVEFGQNKTQVVEGGTSTATLDVEVRITYDATANSKLAALVALDHIRARIQEDAWPPA